MRYILQTVTGNYELSREQALAQIRRSLARTSAFDNVGSVSAEDNAATQELVSRERKAARYGVHEDIMNHNPLGRPDILIVAAFPLPVAPAQPEAPEEETPKLNPCPECNSHYAVQLTLPDAQGYARYRCLDCQTEYTDIAELP